MSSVCLSAVLFALVCLNACQAASVDAKGYCAKVTPISNCTFENTVGDWVVVYSTDIKCRNGASYWGGDFSYDYCDPVHVNGGCMAVGYSILGAKDNKQVGYVYAYNAFTDVWTIGQISNTMYKGPNDITGFRMAYNHYVQVEDTAVFVNKTPTACGSKIVKSGPIYRSTSYVVLAAAPDYSWVALLYCDSFYGFLSDSAPFIQIVVKRDCLDKISYPFTSLYFYEELKAVIYKYNINIYAADFKLVYHDVGGSYPSAVNWESIQWEADCLCTNTGYLTAA